MAEFVATETARATEINGWVGRARAIANVLNALVIAPAVLVYVALVISGYVPFRPLDKLDGLAKELQEHRHERAEIDRRIMVAMETFAKVMARYERRDRLVECHARYPEPKLRDWCLTLGEEAK